MSISFNNSFTVNHCPSNFPFFVDCNGHGNCTAVGCDRFTNFNREILDLFIESRSAPCYMEYTTMHASVVGVTIFVSFVFVRLLCIIFYWIYFSVFLGGNKTASEL
jgi:hypothetical protein